MLVQILIALAIIALLALIIGLIYAFVLKSEKNEAKSDTEKSDDTDS